MKWSGYSLRVSNVFAENRLLKFAMLIVAGTSVFSSIYITRTFNSQRIVLTPPQINHQMWIEGNKASDEYLKEFARYISSLAFSYHPATVRKQFNELLTMFTPSEYENAKKVFYALANRIEEARVGSTFYITDINVWENRTIEVKGYKTTMFPDKLSEEIVSSFYIEYIVNDGKFQIVSILDKESEQKKEDPNAKK